METNQFGSDSHLPPRKRLLAGFKRLNGSSSSSSSSSTSNSSSSASTDVYTKLDDLLSSRFNNNHTQSPEELVEAARSAAALAVRAAKAARGVANEKALISAKAIAAAKRALELVDSFPKDCNERSSPKKSKQKKHVPLQRLYSKRQLRDEKEDLARSSFEENGQINKKQKMIDVAEVVDSESSYEGLESNREAFKPDEVDSIPTPGKEESNSLGRRRGRVKLKKLPLSIL
ncbi:unnamed protein product [Eruca vesicaria subsp. sativa]|uniref:Uncharacterized protein n=1 Tax=Eruca vesicaria subsp. sativa TaxID=29727 RepID=A0ABC8JZ26_ERUVS|nr:unnamed protein product [Eruca vesicaria subsp. sativa]